MVHRGLRETGYRWWVRLALIVLGGAVFSALFVLADLTIYGQMNW